MIVGILTTGVYFAFAFSMVDRFGMLGLVLANSAQFIAHAAIMYWLARTTFGFKHERALWLTIGKCALASSAMALLALGLWVSLDRVLPLTTGLIGVIREASLVLIPAAIGAVVYLVASSLLGIGEVNILVASVRNRLPFLRGAGGAN